MDWVFNNGLAVGILIAIGIAIVATARWLAPRLDRLIDALIGTQTKLQESIDSNASQLRQQVQTCEQHAALHAETAETVERQRTAWVEACRSLREITPNIVSDDQVRQQIERRLTDVERILEGVHDAN